MRRPTAIALTAIAAGVALATPAAAPASVKVGPSMTALDDASGTCQSTGDCAYVHDSLPDPPFEDRSPVDGVIVRWSVKGYGWFQIFPAVYAADNDAKITRRKASTVRYAGSTAAVTEFPARTLIKRRDAIGLIVHQGSTISYNLGFTDNVFDAFIPAPAAGETRQTDSYNDRKGRVGFQAVIERDADGDGYGDESQDGCPGDGTTVGPCGGPPQPPEPPEAETPAPPTPVPPVPAPPPPPPAPADTTAPVFRAKPKVLIERRAVRFRVDLSEPATVHIGIRRRGSRRLTSFQRPAAAGKNGLRVRKTRLRHRRYRAFLYAVDAAGNTSRNVAVRFRVR
jgi:hypothetical protein